MLRSGLLVLLLLVLTGCNFPGLALDQETFEQQPLASAGVEGNLAPLAVISFHAQVPPGTPSDQAIFLDILDEVTGLALNVKRYQMQSISPGKVSIDLPLQVGSIIKYRYSRFGNYPVNEETSQGEPVRYRLYHVINPGVVEDIISSWTDLPFEGPTGRIVGQVNSIIDNTPLVGLLASAGGLQTFTNTDGEFILEGLPPGTHNLVVYAVDGSHKTFQQGALIASEATTPATISLQPAEYVNVEFIAHVPPGTLPAIPIRLAGNLYQLGNTFADLNGGINTIASRMPELTPRSDGTYIIQLSLPLGAYIEYKYTFGDGFWNAEHKINGEFNLRKRIITKEQTRIEDTIETWGENTGATPVLFDVHVPENTPADEYISIQFNPFGWMEPLPMWPLGENHWAYLLISPLSAQENLSYRYCRNDLCGQADDEATFGNDSTGRLLQISTERQTFRDQVKAWSWLAGQSVLMHQEPNLPRPSRGNMIGGVELTQVYHPAFTAHLRSTFLEIRELGANTVILTPTWSFTNSNPPILKIKSDRDPLWLDLQKKVADARELGMTVFIFPQPHFQVDDQSWWRSSPRDFAWWITWFDRYQDFITYHADLARISGAQGIILGGSWLEPALPGGKLADGTPSNVPADANQRWMDLITQARAHFNGEIIWALSANPSGINPPIFSKDIDRFYLLWSIPLQVQGSTYETQEDFERTAGNYLDAKVFPIQLATGKTFLVGVAYPSAEGALKGCILDSTSGSVGSCLDFSLLSPLNPDYPSVNLDLEEQYQAYRAVFRAALQRDWIAGITVRGYYYPAMLLDKSISPRGKPVSDLLHELFKIMTAE